jgi:hypothetical protein
MQKFSFAHFSSSPFRKVANLLIETKNSLGKEALKMKRRQFRRIMFAKALRRVKSSMPMKKLSNLFQGRGPVGKIHRPAIVTVNIKQS